MSLPRSQINDRRGADRHPIKTAAMLSIPGGQVVPARTLDIGKDGSVIVCDINLYATTAVTLRLNLPAPMGGSAGFEASGNVTNCTLAGSDGGFRISLQFSPLSAASAAALKGLSP